MISGREVCAMVLGQVSKQTSYLRICEKILSRRQLLTTLCGTLEIQIQIQVGFIIAQTDLVLRFTRPAELRQNDLLANLQIGPRGTWSEQPIPLPLSSELDQPTGSRGGDRIEFRKQFEQ